MPIPYLDPTVAHVTMMQVRRMSLRNLDKPYLVHDGAQPIAVVLPYAMYLELQELLELPKAERPKVMAAKGAA